MKKDIQRAILVVLDGWGMAPVWGGNAIANANTPNFSHLWNNFSHRTLRASGEAVGLSGSEAGNSEVGHLTMGAGRIIPQDCSRINAEIKNRNFFHNRVLIDTLNECKRRNKKLHLVGLLGSGNVHSSLKHIIALLLLCRINHFSDVFLHLFTDGRDSPPQSALEILEKLQAEINPIKTGQIASISGRYFAMDRDNHWDRTKKAFDILTRPRRPSFSSPGAAVAAGYKKGLTDEWIEPASVELPGKGLIKIEPFDGVIFFNFRYDRSRQLLKMLAEKIPLSRLVSFVPYEMVEASVREDRQIQTCFNMPAVNNHLAEVISQNDLSQMRIAETEKISHVTYFFSGGSAKKLKREQRRLIPSFPVDTFDEYPVMRAPEVGQAALEAIKEKFDFILVNFANADMVGHSGDMRAIIQAVEAVDRQLGKIASTSRKDNYVLIITADHGNAEEEINPQTGERDTEHSRNPVPFILISPIGKIKLKKSDRFGLADVAPTILELFGIPKPTEMTGQSLLANSKIQNSNTK